MMRFRRPSLFAVLLTLAGVAFFVRLGIWQLDRASEKEVLLHRFATAVRAPIRDFASVQRGALPHRYPHLVVSGHYLTGHKYMLDDQVHDHRDGVQVYAVFQPDGRQRLLLVDLGFLPREGAYQKLPQLLPLKPGAVQIKGIYAPPPPPGLKLGGNALAKQKAWPKLTTYIDMRQISHDLHAPVYPRVLLLDPDPSTAYVRQWTPTFMPPARHRGYAFQWFTFAFAAVVIFVILHRKRDNGEDDE
ncbi:SURF1 family protein [Oleiagrimonas sp.]|jgi:surfeit locus 1 family protein|uniref:SURF1 family protein n=1 Tax=Oleiagrimonas sp. TaxID=2010330 RepID=UPI00262F886C|nr:SURF1 family protein [Oleiagrimonas sp.]MDA3913291.1 SURF1 family protein [Oleiagrimonas sp.]